MIAACKAGENAFLQTQLGKTCDVLFETMEKGYYTGYSENYTRVQVKSNEDLQGKVKRVKLLSLQGETVMGEVAE